MILMHRSPTHPGEMLLEEFLKPANISQADAARQMGISQNRLNELIRGKRGVTADTALKLSALLGTSAQFWMNLQNAYDLYQAQRRHPHPAPGPSAPPLPAWVSQEVRTTIDGLRTRIVSLQTEMTDTSSKADLDRALEDLTWMPSTFSWEATIVSLLDVLRTEIDAVDQIKATYGATARRYPRMANG